ncbi:hypothetical protein L6164_021345 [Bauhinia variegata]|uniref:Uncharacterized protein n=1 Tax=Bauhinia variegata TaxID=167791 RepID=A0ACB9MXW3_BAUVA|nr:hypothetical protein L6164_021345 [Bauhinia variegata]
MLLLSGMVVTCVGDGGETSKPLKLSRVLTYDKCSLGCFHCGHSFMRSSILPIPLFGELGMFLETQLHVLLVLRVQSEVDVDSVLPSAQV